MLYENLTIFKGITWNKLFFPKHEATYYSWCWICSSYTNELLFTSSRSIISDNQKCEYYATWFTLWDVINWRFSYEIMQSTSRMIFVLKISLSYKFSSLIQHFLELSKILDHWVPHTKKKSKLIHMIFGIIINKTSSNIPILNWFCLNLDHAQYTSVRCSSPILNLSING